MTNSAQTTLRALTLLAERGQLTVTELSRGLDLPVATAHRVLQNCCAAGYAVQHERGGAYRVGGAFIEATLLLSRATDVRDAADDILSELAERTGEMVSLALLEGRTVRYVQSMPGTLEWALAPRNGHRLPAHCTAAGKAVLSRQSVPELEERFRSGFLPSRTDRTIVDWSRFLQQLATVQQAGWAYSLGETHDSVSAIAAPVVLGTGAATSAVTIVTPKWRMETKADLNLHVRPLLVAADRIQRRLRGGTP